MLAKYKQCSSKLHQSQPSLEIFLKGLPSLHCYDRPITIRSHFQTTNQRTKGWQARIPVAGKLWSYTTDTSILNILTTRKCFPLELSCYLLNIPELKSTKLVSNVGNQSWSTKYFILRVPQRKNTSKVSLNLVI